MKVAHTKSCTCRISQRPQQTSGALFCPSTVLFQTCCSHIKTQKSLLSQAQTRAHRYAYTYTCTHEHIHTRSRTRAQACTHMHTAQHICKTHVLLHTISLHDIMCWCLYTSRVLTDAFFSPHTLRDSADFVSFLPWRVQARLCCQNLSKAPTTTLELLHFGGRFLEGVDFQPAPDH